MADQYAAIDPNRHPALLGHSGTAGTAETVRIIATPAGAMKVDLVSADEIIISVGTLNTIGTLGIVESGTIDTVGAIAAGTQNTLGTVGVVDAIAAGTQNTLGTVGVVESGTVTQSQTYGYNGSAWQNVKVDTSTNAWNTISYEHHEVHAGSSFTVHIDNTTASSDDDRTLLGFETPAGTKWAHLTVYASASSPAEVFIYEGVVIDDGEGTELTIEDRNRNTDNTSTMLSFENPAVAGLATWMSEAEIAGANFSAATTLEHFQLAAGSGPKALGGETRGSQEWVLAPSTKYAVVVQNIGANANLHEIHLDWYEHTDAN